MLFADTYADAITLMCAAAAGHDYAILRRHARHYADAAMLFFFLPRIAIDITIPCLMLMASPSRLRYCRLLSPALRKRPMLPHAALLLMLMPLRQRHYADARIARCLREGRSVLRYSGDMTRFCRIVLLHECHAGRIEMSTRYRHAVDARR